MGLHKAKPPVHPVLGTLEANPHKSLSKATIEIGWWDRSTGYTTKIEHKWEPDQGWESWQSWAGWSQPATPSEPEQGSWSQPSTPTEPGQGKSRSPSRSRDETPLRPSPTGSHFNGRPCAGSGSLSIPHISCRPFASSFCCWPFLCSWLFQC